MSHLKSCNGDKVHGVIDSLEDPHNGGQRILQVISPFTALTVLQHFLKLEKTEETAHSNHTKTEKNSCRVCLICGQQIDSHLQ